MKFLTGAILLTLIPFWSFAQDINYYEHIEPIIKKNCVSCHQTGGIGPFSLSTYDEVKAHGSFIGHVTKTRYMPPWKADPEFVHFKNERILANADIELIQSWIKNGMPAGKKKKRKPANEPSIHQGTKPDLILTMKSPFQIPDTGKEEFRFFSLPTALPQDMYLSGVEFVPGNKRQVHHSRIMTDTTGRIRGIDGMSELDPRVKEFQTIPLVDEFLYGWVPGNEGIHFPSGMGKKLYQATDLVLNIHYSPSSKKEIDQSQIRFFFAKGKTDREVKTLTLREENISNQPFYIPAETVKTFYISYTVESDISLISVLPHMHFIGKTFTAVAAPPEGDAIPIVKIDSWDFNWQSTYVYQNLVKIPAGSVILVQATFDNTSANPANPNHPPKDVTYGWNSIDEMCNLVLYYVDYKEGDEAIKN